MRAEASTSGSSAPVAATGLTMFCSPSGRASGIEMRSRSSTAARPMPTRYVATTLSRPDGRRAPVRPSPNVTVTVPSSARRVV